MRTRLLVLLAVVLLIVVVIAGSCVKRLLAPEPARIWTPAPVRGAAALATQPAATPPAQVAIRPTATTARPSPTPRPAQPPATPDPKVIVITEADVLAAVASGAMTQDGAALTGLAVRFADDRMTLQAASLDYGGFSIQNLVLVGRLAAQDGKLQLVTESITPRGLVTALIPTFANQALAEYTAQWYVEEVRTVDGRLELRIR